VRVAGVPKKRQQNQTKVANKFNDDQTLTMARNLIRPTLQAAVTVAEYGKAFGELDLPALIRSLNEQTDACNDGDMARGEAMLTAQAHTLDAIFNNLARRAINSDYMPNMDCFLKLALRAQSQCRATWEALSSIKNPPVAGYVGQANIAHGPQQVNNGVPPATGSPTAKSKSEQNKLSGEGDELLQNAGASASTGRVDRQVEAVGEIDRPKDAGGEG
jgi:hypothetical protein